VLLADNELIAYFSTSFRDIEPRTRYRLGFWYQVLYSLDWNPSFNVGVFDDFSTWCQNIFNDGDEKTTWEYALTPIVNTSSFVPGADCVSNDVGFTFYQINFTFTDTNPNAFANFLLDNVFLMHARDTTDENLGILTFDWLPDFGSVSWNKDIDRKIIRDGLNTEHFFDPTGRQGRHSRHVFNCKFSQAPLSLYENLETLDWWQNQGHSLVFIHNDARFGNRFPPSLTGKMFLTGYTRNHWDTRRCSFSFKFVED